MKIRFAQIALLTALTGAASAGELFFEDFDTAPLIGDSEYSLSPQFQSGTTSYFLQSNTPTVVGGTTNFDNTDGGFVAGLNINANTNDPRRMTTDSFDISGSPVLQFSFDLALHSVGSSNWDGDSRVEFEYSTDAGTTWETLTTVEAASNNTAPLFEGAAITNTFTTFTTTMGGFSGTSMQFRVIWANLGPGDSLGLDNLQVSAVPLPPAAVAGLGLLAGMGAYRRLRR